MVILLGLFDFILAISTFAMTLTLITKQTVQTNTIQFYIAQLILVPSLLLISGFILLFQGWRLDPILLLGMLCLHSIMIFLLVKDFFVYRGR
jgi:hypothetical protein